MALETLCGYQVFSSLRPLWLQFYRSYILVAYIWKFVLFLNVSFIQLQNYARKKQIGIDTVSLGFRNQRVVYTEIVEKPEDGVIVWGLFLEGARWDIPSESLAESRPKELFTPYVPIWLVPIQNRQSADLAKTLMCPCYKILTRKGVLSTTGHSTNFVTTVEVPTNVSPDHWVKRGVALFLSLAY